MECVFQVHEVGLGRQEPGEGEGEALANEGGGLSWRARALPEGEGAPGGRGRSRRARAIPGHTLAGSGAEIEKKGDKYLLRFP